MFVAIIIARNKGINKALPLVILYYFYSNIDKIKILRIKNGPGEKVINHNRYTLYNIIMKSFNSSLYLIYKKYF